MPKAAATVSPDVPSAAQSHSGTILILGGAGMVGLQVAREAARELSPKKIVIASLREEEVRDAIAFLGPEVEAEPVREGGAIFPPAPFKNRRRARTLPHPDPDA